MGYLLPILMTIMLGVEAVRLARSHYIEGPQEEERIKLEKAKMDLPVQEMKAKRKATAMLREKIEREEIEASLKAVRESMMDKLSAQQRQGQYAGVDLLQQQALMFAPPEAPRPQRSLSISELMNM